MKISEREKHTWIINTRMREKNQDKNMKHTIEDIKLEIEKLDDKTLRQKIYEVLDNTHLDVECGKMYGVVVDRNYDMDIGNVVGITRIDVGHSLIKGMDLDDYKVDMKVMDILDEMTNEQYNRINRKFGGDLKLIEDYIQD
jgi:hypothetical protein